jgi:hypothetical protein
MRGNRDAKSGEVVDLTDAGARQRLVAEVGY